MHKISLYLHIFRYRNILIIFFTQLLTWNFIIHNNLSFEVFFDFLFWLLTISTMLTAAAANLLNDVFDLETDKINKPSKVIAELKIPSKKLVKVYLFMCVLALLFAFSASYYHGITVMFIILLLYFYSVFFKKMLWIGNLVVAFLQAFTILFIWLYGDYLNTGYVFFYALFAFMTGFIREMVKDTEDMEGDAAFGAHTYPVWYGIEKTKLLLKILTGISIFFLAYFIFEFFKLKEFVLSSYLIIFILLPLFYFFYIIGKSDKKSDFSNLSKYLKILMVVGLLSMIIQVI